MLLEFIIIITTIAVISSKNPVHSTLFLVLVFINTAMVLISMGIDFLGIFIIIVYVGAIAILFLFVVMMLNVKLTEGGAETPLKYLPIGFFFGLLFIFLINLFVTPDPTSVWYGATLLNFEINTLFIRVPGGGSAGSVINSGIIGYESWILNNGAVDWINELNIKGNNLVQLGVLLYTAYLPYLMVAAIILLVAMLGVIILTFTQISYKKNHYQTAYQQNSSYLNNHLFV